MITEYYTVIDIGHWCPRESSVGQVVEQLPDRRRRFPHLPHVMHTDVPLEARAPK